MKPPGMFLWAALLPLLVSCSEHDGTMPPSIVLVFIDDMGWADWSCFGNADASTPNIDRLATEGISFEQFYVNAPICSPSRVAISTGQYPQRWGITSYLAYRRQNRERGMQNWLDPLAPMLARSLQQEGYRTGHFGKWHMGGQRDVTEAPPITDYGFDTSVTNFEGMGPKLLPLTMKPGWEEPGKIWADAEILGGPVTWMQRSAITGGFVSRALAFMEQAREEKRPFYINLWPDDVHSPYFPPVEKWGGTKRDLYLAVLEEMDRQLAPLFDYIRNHKDLKQHTLVLVCSDNGPEPGADRAGPLTGYKTHLFEGGIRSPLIVWGPGFISGGKAGTRNKTSVLAAIDLVPSLIELAGAVPPEGIFYDGENMLGTLLGKSEASRSAPVFFSRPPDRKDFYGFENLPDLAVRDGPWKFLCDYDGGRPRLYDLREDHSETLNLAEKIPGITAELTRKVRDWWKSVNTASIPASGRIDTHIHLYDTRREGSCAFLDPVRHAIIYFPHLPEQFARTAGPAGIDYAVVVEASRRREDNDWLLETVSGSELTMACIGNLDPRDTHYMEDLERLSENRKFRGIRIRPETPVDLSEPAVVEALGKLEKLGLVLELGQDQQTTADIVALARRYPDMHIIMNHLAGGRMEDGRVMPADWGERLEALAAEPNVYCKISMVYLLSGEDPAPTTAAFYKPLIDPIVDAFGPERVMFGSNWTLSEMRGSYVDMIGMFDEYCRGRKDLSPEHFYTLNALKAYGIALPETR
jgi:arylsulfatase A-like enzyme/predicted TIM-barrel fold metal-dependent hydrolase